MAEKQSNKDRLKEITDSIENGIKELFESDVRFGTTRIFIGINDYMFDWKLAPGDSFSSPEAVMCFAPDEDTMSLRMHAFVREHVVRGKQQHRADSLAARLHAVPHRLVDD